MRHTQGKLIRKDKPSKPLSDEEVGRFLRHLASVYKDRRTGNLVLAEALIRVADGLVRRGMENLQTSSEGKANDAEPQLLLDPPHPTFPSPSATMSVADGGRIIADQSQTKRQLIDLAAVRFSIPSSKLLKLTVDDVREAIKSALMHEASLAAITEAAEKYGSRRQN